MYAGHCILVPPDVSNTLNAYLFYIFALLEQSVSFMGSRFSYIWCYIKLILNKPFQTDTDLHLPKI